ncbi:zinc-dependent metalloprotease [Salinimicrobium xinjiangense]|uniref:zinc-dependent metalloprotease n=1 Tax=Salinimicrobium xinjiangense TaxID=438596 RepID=UPI00041CC98D|nr:zinc-dependent metalloprotease [Salinimicrobium xinjiangense]
MIRSLLCYFTLVFLSASASAQFLDKKEDLKKFEGYFNFYYDQKEDKIYLEVDKLDEEFLYTHFLTSGVGSNDIGLDRGQLGGGVIVKFQKAGNKLLLVQPNQKFRAVTENVLEKQSVEEAFAKSVLAGFEIKEESKSAFIIDLTPFLMQDAHGVADRLKSGNHGDFKVDPSKSALALERTKAFPENVDFESLLTFAGEAKSRTLKNVLPDAQNLTVIQHHSFVKLPEEGYEKRIFDPRTGAQYISYYDYASPVFEPIEKRWAKRHRLQKKDPDAQLSEAVEPIVYYLDPGTPEPVKSALLEGASWWDEAFQTLGYKNAFQVKMLPEGADPLDVRYNMIQWVHRSTWGWSYGASVVDPRTGEIIKGHVSLGSLRIRQDFMIAQGLMNRPFAGSDENHEKMLELAIARIRQLSAHEVGHTIGFAHNFAASVNDRASVMDYPHPQFKITNGEIDFSEAYDTGLGEWDIFTVKALYGEAPEGVSERAFLNDLIAEATAKGLQFISDSDARATGGAHINAHLWDNGRSAVEELEHILEVRKIGIENFSEDNIRKNEPFSVLEDVFVPVYFLHRYQTEAAVKLIGGLNYNYAVKGGTEDVQQVLDRDSQKAALNAILETLSPEVLAIPQDKLDLFPPRAFGFSRRRESFKSNTGVSFDALGAPGTASEMTLSLLLHPQRAARLVQQNALDRNQLGLGEVLETLAEKTIKQPGSKKPYLEQVQNVVNYNVLQSLLELAANDDATPVVKAEVYTVLQDLEKWLGSRKDPASNFMLQDIKSFWKDPSEFKPVRTVPQIPDGSPIGSY